MVSTRRSSEPEMVKQPLSRSSLLPFLIRARLHGETVIMHSSTSIFIFTNHLCVEKGTAVPVQQCCWLWRAAALPNRWHKSRVNAGNLNWIQQNFHPLGEEWEWRGRTWVAGGGRREGVTYKERQKTIIFWRHLQWSKQIRGHILSFTYISVPVVNNLHYLLSCMHKLRNNFSRQYCLYAHSCMSLSWLTEWIYK